MVSQVEQNALPKPPVLFVGEKDSTKLLEVYVKRSLSLNDGSYCPPRREQRPRKWVTHAEQDKRDRKHSSDTSLHLKTSFLGEDLGEDEAFSEPETDRKAKEEGEPTDNTSKLWKKKSTHGRNNGSSASHTSDGKQQKLFVHFDKDKIDGRQPNIRSLHPKPSATEEDLTKDKVFSEPVTESETSDKYKRWKKSSLTRKDGSSASQSSDGKPRKWFSPFDKDKRNSKLPHDSFKVELEDLKIAAPLPPAQPQPESLTKVKKTKEGKKIKRPSVWKNFLGWFSRGNTDKQDEHDDDDGRTEEALPTTEPATPPLSCLPISTGDGIILRHTKSTRRRRSQRKLSLKRRSGDASTVRPLTLDLSSEAHNSQVQSVEEVDATSSYYEKMSEELEKIVNEVKNTPTEENKTFIDSIQPTDTETLSRSQEEIIKRIIELIKHEGDVINDKLKENTIMSSYFNTITYGSFQQLADQYVNSEVHQQATQPTVVASELVKFAFTLDFTARVAGLSRHAPGNILGFGNQYLKERFTYTCESHPHVMDTSTEKPVTAKENSDRDERLGDHAASETDGPKH
ncbi:uncharacterized protein LOC132844536 [Tachysurus vachellii]|uniref:uncharacterized protein LOC132844536 n=1 Tax=Tachysurus vachellii TaxID=175792 RepID=UPI00296A9BDC|nr:uncharacterized protein LOC132844536 [Tachysurus vachellii]